MKAAISATYVALLFTVLLLSWDNYKSALGQSQQQFQNYQNPTLGFSIQHPSDWQIEEEPGEQVTFEKEKDIVQFLVDVHSLDSPDITLAKYVQDEITNKREERQGFKLIESTPMTISDGKAPAHKLVYTFLKEDEPRSGETNKIQRIFTIEGDKVYSIAYLAEIDKYDDSLPLVEKMVDSFRLSDSDSGSSTTQVQSSDRSSEDDNGSGNCDRISYPDPNVCIPPYPPDLNCPDISYTNFQVRGSDPHGFDRDKDGTGCESTEGGGVTPPDNGDGTPPERDCDPSYPGVCIKSPPPDLNCPDIPDKNFRVTGADPHGFDGDNDGIGCDSQGGGVSPPDNGDGTPPDNDNGNCDPSYPGVCIKSPPPDLNCPDIPDKNFRVTGADPHGFDGDNDGIGCESAVGEDTPPITPPEQSLLTPTPVLSPPFDPPELFGLRTPTPVLSPPFDPPELFGLRTPTPTPPVIYDPSPLARSQPQLQCEFGVNPETGLCNTEDIPSEPVPPTPVPTTTPEEESSAEEEPEEEVEEAPEEEIVEEPEEETGGDNDNSEDSTFGS